VLIAVTAVTRGRAVLVARTRPCSKRAGFNTVQSSFYVFTAVSSATHNKSFKIQNLKFLKLSIAPSCMCLFDTCIPQHVSAYWVIIRRIKIVGEVAALLYIVVKI
jgi:hypothetical protein